MAVADGHQYGFLQQLFLELVKSEYCNHTLYKFFKAKALKLEAKFHQRDDELESAQESIGAKDKEIQELKEKMNEKAQAGTAEEKLRQEVASLRGDFEKPCAEASSSRGERNRQASRIKELVAKIIKEADKWNDRVAQHNKMLADVRKQRDYMISLHNSLSGAHTQYKGVMEWTRQSLHEARKEISRLQAKVTDLGVKLRQARSSHGPDVREYTQRLVRERYDVRAEAHALSKALPAYRVDVARLVDSEKNLEVNMYWLTKGIEKMSNEVNRLHHLDSMKQVELDECQFALKNLQLDYKKISDEYDFLDEARDAVVNEFEIASANVEELERQLGLKNEKLDKAQSELVNQQGRTKYYEGLAGSRDVVAKESTKEVERMSSLLNQSELKINVITHEARRQLAEEACNHFYEMDRQSSFMYNFDLSASSVCFSVLENKRF
ncbi:early endosome antigen 1-like [Papaver somniferum]|uniref:early endosome antigen 1-like n=1 Tax=Papaver somniferum TaxID=3469 RepID=UPI000E6F6D82|nr:early endosome antigen 1-like [Papaver somniferum]